MSWFAQHYVLKKCSHPLVRGIPKFLLLVIAYFVRKNHTVTPLLSLRQLEELLGVDNRTVRRNRDLLCSSDVGELTRHVHGKRDQFEMLKLAGPLFVDARLDYATAKMRAQSPDFAARMRAQSPDSRLNRAVRMRAQSPHFAQMRAQSPDFPPALVRIEEEEIISSSELQDAGALESRLVQDLQKVDRFADWWEANYPAHNSGVLDTVRDCDRDAALILLKARTLERLQAMALVYWAVEADGHRGSDRWYIAHSDRSIRVLLEKATFIERELVRLEMAPQGSRPSRCRHDPPCASDDACIDRSVAKWRARAGTG